MSTGRSLVPVEEHSDPGIRGPLRRELRGSAWLGLAIIVLFFAIGGGWMATAKLSRAAIAQGAVTPEGSRQTVQHLEGGIIRDLLVADGDLVARGDQLVTLEGVSAQADVDTLTSRLRTLAAKEARLRAERVGAAMIQIDHPSLSERGDPEVIAVIAQETNQFYTRRANDRNREAIMRQRIVQLEQQIAGAEQQVESVRQQMLLIQQEIETVEGLVRRGLARMPRLLALQRAEADLAGEEGDFVARIARTEEAIGETRLQIINLKIQRAEEIDAELGTTQAARAEVEVQSREGLDRLSRTDIVAPVDGTVLNIRFKTPGGVIRPGEAILDIVPLGGGLVINARVSPRDIDDVHSGLAAYVTFPSYPQRHLLRIDGTVTHVSADTLEDERSGQIYYDATVRVDRDHLMALAPDVELTPGLPAVVYITGGERTMLDYMLQPVMESLERSFRER